MSDLGAKVSIKDADGKSYDVKTCADRFLCASTSFQYLKIHSTYTNATITGTKTKPASGTNTITATHNLGYLAPYIVVYNGSTTRGTGTSYFFCDVQSTLVTRNYTDRIEIDISETFDVGSNAGDTVYFTVYVFLDNFATVNESTIETGETSTEIAGDYGFRVSKLNKDVKDCDDVDLINSSAFFNNVVHKKGSSVPAAISHDLGYVPNFLLYLKYSGDTHIEYVGIYAAVSTTELDFSGAPVGSTAYYIIFKDKA